MTLRFRQERFRDIEHELVPLFQEHWDEIALDKDSIPLEPDWQRFRQMDDTGSLCIVTAREDGELVGYYFWIIFQALHYASLRAAEADMFFLRAKHRRGLNGLKMLKAAERIIARLGVQKAFSNVKIHKDVGLLFERLGWKAIERVYAKRL